MTDAFCNNHNLYNHDRQMIISGGLPAFQMSVSMSLRNQTIHTSEEQMSLNLVAIKQSHKTSEKRSKQNTSSYQNDFTTATKITPQKKKLFGSLKILAIFFSKKQNKTKPLIHSLNMHYVPSRSKGTKVSKSAVFR